MPRRPGDGRSRRHQHLLRNVESRRRLRRRRDVGKDVSPDVSRSSPVSGSRVRQGTAAGVGSNHSTSSSTLTRQRWRRETAAVASSRHRASWVGCRRVPTTAISSVTLISRRPSQPAAIFRTPKATNSARPAWRVLLNGVEELTDAAIMGRPVKRGDLWQQINGTSGGYGDPLERQPEAVADDLAGRTYDPDDGGTRVRSRLCCGRRGRSRGNAPRPCRDSRPTAHTWHAGTRVHRRAAELHSER